MDKHEETHNSRTKLLDVVPLNHPYVLMIDPCGICNFKCSFCPCNNDATNFKRRHSMMSMELFEKVASDMEKFPEKVNAVDLYGFGEPLLNRHLPDMIALLKRKNLCQKVRLATNASLLDEEMGYRLVESGLDYMKISIEALDDSGYRDLCGVDVRFNDILNNVRKFHDTAMKYTGTTGKATEIGIKIVSSSLKTDKDKKFFYNTFSPLANCIFIENIKSIWAEFDSMEFPPGAVPKEDYYSAHTKGYSICSYPLTHMLVHSNGDIGVCCHDWKHGTCYANVRDISLTEAWNSNELKEFRIKHLKHRRREIPYCSACTQKGYDNVDADADKIALRLSSETVFTSKQKGDHKN